MKATTEKAFEAYIQETLARNGLLFVTVDMMPCCLLY